MYNIKSINNTIYKFESFWKRDGYDLDDNKNKFPIPKEQNEWDNKQVFLEKILLVQNFVESKKNFVNYSKKEQINCLICNKKNINKKLYKMNRIIWEDSLFHYVDIHNIKPSEDFINIILNFNIYDFETKIISRMKSSIITNKKLQYLKITQNQINIMDALMEHGGYTKKYFDKKNDKLRYSEHAGLLDFNFKRLEKIVISGNTNDITHSDDEIFLPTNSDDMYDYEYIFHTHPPTPKPGHRYGIIYDFPSISDIFHFIEHYNNGKMQGSIVITPEGLYNIRKYNFDGKPIKYDRKDFYQKVRRSFIKIQDLAIDKYGTNISKNKFYSKVAQDTEFIKQFNETLNLFDIKIDFYPRKLFKGQWLIQDVYLPVFPIQKK